MQYPFESRTTAQREAYSYFLGLYVDTVGDPSDLNKEALGSYGSLLLDILSVKDYLIENGTTYESVDARNNSTLKARPEVAQLDKMESRLLQMKRQLGFYQNENAGSSDLGGLEQFM